MFLSNLLPEIGVHFLHPLFGPGDLIIVDIPYRDIKEGSYPSSKLNRLFLVRTGWALDLIFRSNRIKS